MFETLYQDLDFIRNKYHKTDEPFDAYNRMNYHGYEYDSATGLDDKEMDKGLAKLYEEVKELPHPIAKAKLFEYVLSNARIDVNEKDWFAGFYNWGRPLKKYTLNPWYNEVFKDLTEEKNQMDLLSETGVMTMWPDFDHVIPDWNSLTELGFKGLLKRAEEYHASHRKNGISPETDAFFEGIEISYKAIINLLDRYYKYALTKTHEKAQLQAECFKNLRDGAPTNLYEALQSMYIFFIVCECVDHYQTRSLGNGIDSTLLPFYLKDINGNKFSKEQETEFMAYFFMQFSAIGNYWGHPMYLAGTNPDGSSKVNEVSHLILDIYKELRIYNPKIQIKTAQNTPKDFLYKVFDLVRSGISSFVFCCEPGYMKAVMSYGATKDEALNFEISGCYETRVKGKESSTSTGYINTAKIIELVIYDGCDSRTGKTVGLPTKLSEIKSFEDPQYAKKEVFAFLDEANKQGVNMAVVGRCDTDFDAESVRISAPHYDTFDMSVLEKQGCLKSAIDGGCIYADGSFSLVSHGILTGEKSEFDFFADGVRYTGYHSGLLAYRKGGTAFATENSELFADGEKIKLEFISDNEDGN